MKLDCDALRALGRRDAGLPSRKLMRKLAIALLLILVAAGVVLAAAPALVDRQINRVHPGPPHRASERARALYPRLIIIDLHADPLLWDRDLLERATYGHVDVPRLIEGNVALQAFTVVTKTPFFLNIDRNDDSSDMITLLAMANRWPPRTWGSLKERALYQAEKLHDLAARSGGRLRVIKDRAQLERYLVDRAGDPKITAGFLGLEGAHALEGDVANIDTLFDAGFRMMAHAHFFDNDMSGSAHGVEQGGLSEKGREMIRRMEAKKILLDLAHASTKAIDDALAIVTRPVVVSHTGVKGTCNNARNLSDEHVRGVARTGGVIGVGYWDTATCGSDARSIARAMRHVANLVGIDHVALGSDFDGATTTPFDTAGLIALVDALFAEAFSDEDVAKIMGGNALRVLRATMP